jgi:hypothetical protein
VPHVIARLYSKTAHKYSVPYHNNGKLIIESGQSTKMIFAVQSLPLLWSRYVPLRDLSRFLQPIIKTIKLPAFPANKNQYCRSSINPARLDEVSTSHPINIEFYGMAYEIPGNYCTESRTWMTRRTVNIHNVIPQQFVMYNCGITT